MCRAAVLLQARAVLGLASADDYVRWAVNALESDADSPALRELAGADLGEPARLTECSGLFQASLGELGISVGSGEAAIREYVRVLAQAIVDGEVDPQEQVDRIHREVLSPLNHPWHLMVWCYLHDGLRPSEFKHGFDGVHFDCVEGQARDAAILEGARWYLRVERAAEQGVAADEAR